MKEYLTPWQRKTMWAALTACSWLFSSYGRRRDLGRRQCHQFSPADSDTGGDRRDSCLSARSPGDENVSRNAYPTKAIVLLFAIAFFALGGLVAWLVPTISFQSANSAGNPFLHRAGSELHC